jgi:hypothetical protein
MTHLDQPNRRGDHHDDTFGSDELPRDASCEAECPTCHLAYVTSGYNVVVLICIAETRCLRGLALI